MAPYPTADQLERITGGLPLSVEAYFRLVEDGVLGADDRVELLDGEIVPMTPPDPIHSNAVARLHEVIVLALRGRLRVRCQQPLVGSRSVPEPDLLVTDGSAWEPIDSPHPRTALLVVEVSNSSLRIDRGIKVSIYAEAGVPEYWIVDLDARRIEVRTVPDPTRRTYGSLTIASPGERLRPRLVPDVEIDVAALLR